MELKKMFDLDFILEYHKISEDREKEKKKISKFVTKVLKNLDKSKLTPVDLKGHKVSFFELWNEFVKGSDLKKSDMEWIVTKWSHCLGRMTIVGLSKKRVTDEVFWDHVKHLGVQALNNECQMTEDYLSVSLDDNFNFVFEKYQVESEDESGIKVKSGPLS